MQDFWHGFYIVFDVLMIVAGIGLIGVIGFLIVTVLQLKNTAFGSAKRLSQPPLKAAKAIGAMGKGIAQQEQVRFQHIAGTVKASATDVRVTAAEVKAAVQTINPDDLKVAARNAKMGIQFIRTLMKVAQASPHQSE